MRKCISISLAFHYLRIFCPPNIGQIPYVKDPFASLLPTHITLLTESSHCPHPLYDLQYILVISIIKVRHSFLLLLMLFSVLISQYMPSAGH